MAGLINRGANVNASDNRGATALHLSVVTGHLEAVKLLVNAPELDVNAQDGSGDTALHEAVAAAPPAANGCNSITEILCSLDGLDLTRVNVKGFNVLHYAAVKGNAYVVDAILTRSTTNSLPLAVNDKKASDGYTALHLAVLNGHLEVCTTPKI